ncbi:N-acetylmuramoyl-L-alanine amidase [Bacillus timonensis]|nr:N-acetylmuramoyl-L-alanine amidase [Bacillus timonensis]
MKIVLDAGHGYQAVNRQTIDGMREYEFNRAVVHYARELLMRKPEMNVYFSHDDSRDVSLVERAKFSNRLKTDLFISIHANSYRGEEWNGVHGIETYIHRSMPIEAYRLAQRLQRNLIHHTQRLDRGIKTADFYLLREVNATAIICECGFMTNRDEARLLKTDRYRRACAKAIADSVLEHYFLYKNTAARKTLQYQ